MASHYAISELRHETTSISITTGRSQFCSYYSTLEKPVGIEIIALTMLVSANAHGTIYDAFREKIWLALFALLFTQMAQADDLRGKVTRVIDGDSVILETVGGKELEIRLTSIDAPEHNQPFGTRSKAALQALVIDRRVAVRVSGVDRYQRLLGCPILSGSDVCLQMVRSGNAWVYRPKTDDATLLAAEESARAKRVGIWSLPKEQAIPPWQWRIQKRKSPAPGDCQIKGNINASGRRIYHLPGQRHYDRTRVSSSKGERWFCTEAQATAAGWRKSRR